MAESPGLQCTPYGLLLSWSWLSAMLHRKGGKDRGSGSILATF